MRITKRVFELGNAASGAAGRHAINGIHLCRVDAETVRAEATDGMSFVRLEWVDKGKGKFDRVLPLPACRILAALVAESRDEAVVIDESSPPGKINVHTEHGVLLVDDVPGKFPKTDGIIPKYGKISARFCVDPVRWDGVLKAMPVCVKRKGVSVTLPPPDGEKSNALPVLFESKCDEFRATGVLMQMKGV